MSEQVPVTVLLDNQFGGCLSEKEVEKDSSHVTDKEKECLLFGLGLDRTFSEW